MGAVTAAQPGDILLFTESRHENIAAKALDWLIAASTDSPFVHAALVIDGTSIIDPLWTVQELSFDRYAQNGWRFSVEATEAQKAAAVAWAVARIGQRYGVSEILEDGARFDLHLPFVYRVHPTRLTCSGFVVAAYLAAGVTLTYAPLPAPSDLSYSPLLVGARPWRV